MPFIPGMLMSISTSSGCSFSTRSMASAPLAASPASSKPSRRRSTALTAKRNGAWSSTTSTGCEPVTLSAWHRPRARRQGAATATMVGSASPALPQEHQHRLDPAVHVLLLAQAQLGEDRVGVLFHRPFGYRHRRGDGGVVLALGHLGQDLRLPRAQRV